MTQQFTPHYGFVLPVFNQNTWADDLNGALSAIDAIIYEGLQVAGAVGVWENGAAYNPGDRLTDETTAAIYTCSVPHTSAALGSFSADRVAHPTYWIPSTLALTARGAWAKNTVYTANDLTYQVSEGISAICVTTHTSTNASGGTIRTDASKWVYIVDISAGAVNSNVVVYDHTASGLTAIQVQAAIDEIVMSLALKAPKASPALTGTPVAPTAAVNTNTTQLATTAFVQAQIAALSLLTNFTVRAATTANITIATALNNGDTLDGLTLATDERVLVKDQSTPAENGIWKVGVTPVRVTDADTWAEIINAVVNVTAGTANAGLSFRNTNNAGGTIDVTGITYVQFGAGTISLPLALASGGTAAVTAAAARTNLGLEIGSNVQAYDADLAALAALGWANGDMIYYNAGLQRLAKGTDGQVMVLASGLPAWTTRASAAPDIILEDQKASGTHGGTFSSGALRTRTLNTEVRDILGICSLSANQFTLSVAGTYYIEWSAPGHSTGGHRSALYDVTGGVTLAQGANAGNDHTVSAYTHSEGSFVVTTAGANVFEIQHRCTTTENTDGFGFALSYGTVEVYTRVKIWKVG